MGVITGIYKVRDFQILSDAAGGCKPIDAICQFEYKNHQISISTAGMSKGACHTEVVVLTGDTRDDEVFRGHTVQDAIDFINGVPE